VPEKNHPPRTEKTTWVIGHRNPDTDAICSAIAYADFLRRTRVPKARAACCGPPNSRTEWVLAQARLSRPRLKSDVYLRAAEICRRDVVVAKSNDTVITAYRTMTEHGIRSLPVVDGDGSFVGLLALQDLLPLLIPDTTEGSSARQVTASLPNVAEVLGAEILHTPDGGEEEVELLMMVAGSSEPVMQDRIDHLPKEKLIIITGDRVGVQLRAVEAGVRALVITSGFRPSEAILLAARANGTAILVTERDTASSTQLIRGSRSIRNAISTDFVSFAPQTKLQEIKDRIKKERKQALFPVRDPESKELLGVFSRTDLVNPERQRLILVDHNEFSQAVAGAEEAEIVEVIDHHRLSGNLVTKEPILFINKTVGSTCTIVGDAFRTEGIVPERGIALCICAGIISDTLNLTSPTTTGEDREVLAWASEIAGIDVDQFKDFFFAAGSVLNTSEPAETVHSDRKEFEESGYRISISQVEEVDFGSFWDQRDRLQAELARLVDESQLDLACLMVTDITLNNSLLLIEAPGGIRNRISYPKRDSHLFVLNGVVSRKKQLFPYLSSVLAEFPKSEAD